jgi:hypothetical protein
LPQFPERVLLRKVCASMATQESCASSTVSWYVDHGYL